MARLLPVPVTALPRAADRMSFLYLEHCVVHREDGALTARNEQGMMRVPAASLLAVFLGPGTSISHQAMMLLGECGTTAVWVGERGVRYYAHGRSLATSGCWSNKPLVSLRPRSVWVWHAKCTSCVSRART